MDWKSKLGPQLRRPGGSNFNTSSLNVDIVGLYFSAHWCPPCRGFTPQLSAAYTLLKNCRKSIEIVFISSDQNESSFTDYHNSMAFPAVPYNGRSAALKREYGVNGIPTLILFSGRTGQVITRSGRQVFSSNDYLQQLTSLGLGSSGKYDDDDDEDEDKPVQENKQPQPPQPPEPPQEPSSAFGSGWHRMTTMWQRNGKSLDVHPSRTNQVQLADTGNYTGQMWKIRPVRGHPQHYRLSTRWQGDGKCLEVIQGRNNQVQLGSTSDTKRQYWKIVPARSNYYRITSAAHAERSLDIVNDGQLNRHIQLAQTGNYSGQYWKITEL